MEFVFAYLAGLLTLINPCVLPVLPIVLASALQADKRGPIALAAGMSVSFVALGVGVAAVGYTLGIDADTIAQAGAVLMIGFGLLLLIPRFSAVFATATAGVSERADVRMGSLDRSGLGGQFAGGALLGAVWSPCVGPTLGGAIALASQGKSLPLAALIMMAFALGVSTVIILLGYGARAVLVRRRDQMQRLAQRSRPILGFAFILVGAAILFRLHHIAEAWAVQNLPSWLIDFSVSI
ncbi:cytochrome c biogenesis CcdA family protein [Aliiroseovarius sp. YM-037]|uniref:cytochrome c biogenesis CcdA family protein n=1 Tax=Aliiroseovarius sp. YM-037 TaxID=3341728 RepID=UPI003A80DE29